MRSMTKTKKIIVLATAVLILCAILYPPYQKFCQCISEGKTNTDLSKTGWDWIFNVNKTSFKSQTEPYMASWFWYSQITFNILSVEIFGILVLAGEGLLITKKAK